ncbi:MAG: RraA family protein [Candidatus Planktophila sp.]|jgi:regulator of RNase E activity RraA
MEDKELLDGFDKLRGTLSLSAVIADSMGRAGVMVSQIKPIDPTLQLIGRAVTVELTPGDLQDPLGVLDYVSQGDVIVMNAYGDTETSALGGLMGALFKLKGVRGAVIDGACRDSDENRLQGFQVFSRSLTPRGTHTMFSGRKTDIRYQTPIVCGGVSVSPGDYIFGDELGVVVVPKARAVEVLKLATEQADREAKTREKIQNGWTVQQILDEFGRI